MRQKAIGIKSKNGRVPDFLEIFFGRLKVLRKMSLTACPFFATAARALQGKLVSLEMVGTTGSEPATYCSQSTSGPKMGRLEI
jgi:hypothetical protein